MDRIKNAAILAHVDAGKTTVTENLLFHGGSTRRVGRVDDGTAHTDYDPIERQRGISVFASSTAFVCDGVRINIIDTPGHTDFAGETERSLMAADGAVLVVSAVEGVESYTESLWQAVREAGLACIVFINKIDRAGSDVSSVLSEIENTLGTRAVLMNEPVREGTKDCGIKKRDIEAELAELLSDYDDGILEKYLDGKMPSWEEMQRVLGRCMRDGSVTPVFCGSALYSVGISALADGMARYLPDAECDEAAVPSGVIYKIEHDKTMGKLAHIRMFGGTLSARDEVELKSPEDISRQSEVLDESERRIGKISQIRRADGEKSNDIGRVSAGDIAVLCGLSEARVSDIIGDKIPEAVHSLANPFLRVKAVPKDKSKLTALAAALRELSDEEPYINSEWEKTEGEITLSITGKIQLEIISLLLRERYGLEADFTPPTVIYKETPINAAEGYECYTMPKPCWAIVRLLIEPMPRGSGVFFDRGNVPNNKLFYKYQEHIRRSVFESTRQGIHGWEVTDFRATLIDGEHHTIHTHPLDFFLATPIAFLRGLTNCGSRLLEPTLNIRFTAPEEYVSKIIGDITLMRGEFDSPVLTGGKCHIDAIIPASECMDYPTKFASMTSGKGRLRSTFHGYRDCPDGIGCDTPYRGVCPLDRAKWILFKRGAIQ